MMTQAIFDNMIPTLHNSNTWIHDRHCSLYCRRRLVKICELEIPYRYSKLNDKLLCFTNQSSFCSFTHGCHTRRTISRSHCTVGNTWWSEYLRSFMEPHESLRDKSTVRYIYECPRINEQKWKVRKMNQWRINKTIKWMMKKKKWRNEERINTSYI